MRDFEKLPFLLDLKAYQIPPPISPYRFEVAFGSKLDRIGTQPGNRYSLKESHSSDLS